MSHDFSLPSLVLAKSSNCLLKEKKNALENCILNSATASNFHQSLAIPNIQPMRHSFQRHKGKQPTIAEQDNA